MKNKSEKSYNFSPNKQLFSKKQVDLADSSESQVKEIPIDELYEFKNHPFKVVDDEKMAEMVISVKEEGLLHPIIARIRPEGGYEIISGHRRKHACKLAGILTVPVLLRNFSDDEAIVAMVDSNFQRERLLVSEKAKSYAMKYHAEKRQGKASGDGSMLKKLSEEYKESQKQIQRYIWLARLLPELLDFVDEKKLGITQGVDFSFLNKEQQAWVLLVIKIGDVDVTTKQSAEIKRLALENPTVFTFDIVQEILAKKVVFERKLSFNEKKLSRYFDRSYTNKDIEELIIRLLDEWKESNDGGTQE